MTLISLLVLLIVLGVVFWASRTLMAAFAVPAPVPTVVTVLLVVVALVVLLRAFGLAGDWATLRLT